MPQCLKCPNQFKFSYNENSYNEAEYDSAGNLMDVVYKEFYDLENIKCMVCGSKDVEGKL
jgi:hypothetical protein